MWFGQAGAQQNAACFSSVPSLRVSYRARGRYGTVTKNREGEGKKEGKRPCGGCGTAAGDAWSPWDAAVCVECRGFLYVQLAGSMGLQGTALAGYELLEFIGLPVV